MRVIWLKRATDTHQKSCEFDLKIRAKILVEERKRMRMPEHFQTGPEKHRQFYLVNSVFGTSPFLASS